MNVGVIMPVHAPAGGSGAVRERFLGQALDGVLSQRPAPVDVVVVDDGSPVPIALDEVYTPRCRLVRRDRRGGPGAARDTALELLDTELIACADADDVWHPGKLAAQLRAFGADPGLAVCFGAAEIVGADGRPTGEEWITLPPGPQPPDRFAPQLFAHNPIPTSSAVIRRAALQAAGGFSGPPLCEDWALWLRLLERGERFAFEPDAVISYRRHAGGASAAIAALAESAMFVHDTHAGLADERTRRRVRAADLTALARGRVRERRYGDARRALAEAATLSAPAPRERALALILAVPVLRGLLGRRAPY